MLAEKLIAAIQRSSSTIPKQEELLDELRQLQEIQKSKNLSDRTIRIELDNIAKLYGFSISIGAGSTIDIYTLNMITR